jgi:molybdenum cofactor cytidylyltransferase
MAIAGIILAAGESSRMGRDKALLPWPPGSAGSAKTLLSAAIHALSEHSDLVIVVAGANHANLQPVVWACGASLVRNPAPEMGQFSSLQTGLHDILGRGWDNALVTLVDRPPPKRETLAALARAFEDRGHDTWAVVPEFEGKHGHPILISREMIEGFLKAPPTSNAREVEHSHHLHVRYLAVEDPAVTMNMNTPEDYASVKSKF